MPSPDYLPLALELPAVYQEDRASFDQLDSFLGLLDTLLRDRLTDLDDAERWLGPDGLLMWPPGLAADATPAAVAAAHLANQAELAAWTGFAFPVSWSSLALRRDYLRRAARVWRRRGTPAGLLDWFGLVFGAALGGTVPALVEHFRVFDPLDPDVAEVDPWLRATLFVRGDGEFAGLSRRREAIAFVDRYAPAHVLVRVCWVRLDAFDLGIPPTPGSPPADVAAWRQHVREILCGLVSFVDHAHGIRVWECVDAGAAQDRLGVGALPGAGTTLREDPT
jgi:hypothetical protein